MSNSVFRTGYFVLSVLVALGMTPVIVDALGDRMYGLWVIIGAFMGYYGFLDFGISTAVARFVARAGARGDQEEINSVVSSSFALFLGISALILLATGVALVVSTHYIDSGQDLRTFQRAVMILSIHLALGFPLRVFNGILVANLRYDLHTWAALARLIIGNGLVYFVLAKGGGIVSMAWSLFFAHLLQYSLFVLFALKVCPGIRISRGRVNPGRVRELLGYSGKSLMVDLANILRFRIDLFVVAGFLNLNQVTYYAIGARLIEYFVDLMGSLIGNMTPIFSRVQQSGGAAKLRETLLQLVPFNALIAIWVGACMFFYGEPFMIWWMGPDFVNSHYVMVILCVPLTVSLMQMSGINLLFGMSRHRALAFVNVGGGILNLILSIVLVRYWGIFGVALGTAIEVMLLKVFIEPCLICQAIDLPKAHYYRRYLIISIKTLLPLMLFFQLTGGLARPELPYLLLSGILATMFIGPVAFYFVLGESERDLLRSALRRSTPKSSSASA